MENARSAGKKLTIGVDHRVEDLADRPEGYRPAHAKAFENVVPLQEVIASSTGSSAASRKTGERYLQMLASLGPEFRILRELPLAEIENAAGAQIAEGIRRMRAGRWNVSPAMTGNTASFRSLRRANWRPLQDSFLFSRMP